MSLKFYDSCRFCLNFVETTNRIEISEAIRKLFKKATDIDLKTDCLYPDFHCNQCSQELKKCLEIKEKFSESQRILKEHFKSENNDLGEHQIKPEFLFCTEIKDEIFDEEEFNLEPDQSEDENDSNSESETIKIVEKNRRKLRSKRLKPEKSVRKVLKKKQTETFVKQKRNSVLCTDCGKTFGKLVKNFKYLELLDVLFLYFF